MVDDQPLPYGLPPGPACTTPELAARFVDGGRSGSSPEAHIELTAVYAGAEPVAMRVDDVVLVREDASPAAHPVVEALRDALSAAALELVEADTPLAVIVETETFGRHCYAWGLWAADAEQGRQSLADHAAGDMPGLLAHHERQQQHQAEVDAVLAELDGVGELGGFDELHGDR